MLHRQRKCQGFSLLQSLIVVAIAAILAAMVLPNFTSMISSNRLTTSTNDMLASLNLARSEAIKRGKDVVVRRSGDNWEDGWVVFVDLNRSPDANRDVFNDDGDTNLCEAGEDCMIKQFSPTPATISLRGNNNISTFIRYTSSGVSNYVPDGLSNVADDYFVFCDRTKNTSAALPQPDTVRVIMFNSLGNPKLAEDTDTTKDGVPNLPSGNVPSCLF